MDDYGYGDESFYAKKERKLILKEIEKARNMASDLNLGPILCSFLSDLMRRIKKGDHLRGEI